MSLGFTLSSHWLVVKRVKYLMGDCGRMKEKLTECTCVPQVVYS